MIIRPVLLFPDNFEVFQSVIKDRKTVKNRGFNAVVRTVRSRYVPIETILFLILMLLVNVSVFAQNGPRLYREKPAEPEHLPVVSAGKSNLIRPQIFDENEETPILASTEEDVIRNVNLFSSSQSGTETNDQQPPAELNVSPPVQPFVPSQPNVANYHYVYDPQSGTVIPAPGVFTPPMMNMQQLNPQVPYYGQPNLIPQGYGYYNPYMPVPQYPQQYQPQYNPYSQAPVFLYPQNMLGQYPQGQNSQSGSDEGQENGGFFAHLAPISISSPLLSCVKQTLHLMNPFNVPDTPDRGIGRPLVKDSWLDRPKYWGFSGGVLGGSELISGMVDQKSGGMVSLTYGKYIDNYWGFEGRFSYASLTCEDSEYAQIQYALYHLDSVGYVPPLISRSNRILMGDVSIHYYPLGNARWRPYMKLGVGVTNQRFKDTFGSRYDISTISMPFGIGLRFWWNKNIALNMELTDNVIFQRSEAKTQNNISFQVGITYAYGRSGRHTPKTYWPYAPSARY